MKSVIVLTVMAMLLLMSASSTYASLSWSTAVDHNSSQTNQMRSIALGNNSVYIGYIQTSGYRDVERHDIAAPYTLLNNRGLSYAQPKGIATDDRGYVYVGNREGSGSYTGIIAVHNATLGSAIATYTASMNDFGGVATYRVGANYYLYVARESNGQIYRYDVTNPMAISLDSSFGANGIYTVAGGGKLRGITVDANGTIFVADRDNNKIFRISSDLTSQTSATVTKAMDVALFGDKAYVTSYNGQDSLIAVFNASTLNFVENIIISQLDGNAYTRGTSEGFSGIDIGADGRIWLCDQAYATNKDRLLVSSPIPEPATMLLLGLGALGLLRKRG